MTNEEPVPRGARPSGRAHYRYDRGWVRAPFSVTGSTSGDPVESTGALFLIAIAYAVCVTALLAASGFLFPPNVMGALAVIAGTGAAFAAAIRFLYR